MAKSKTRTKSKPGAKSSAKAAPPRAKPAAKSAARAKPAPAAAATPVPTPAPAPKPSPPSGPVLRGFRSVIYQVPDLPRAKAFYGALLGRAPYFDQPFYVGFDLDGIELGLDPDTSRIASGPGGAIAYWRVDDLHDTWEHSIGHGAEPIEPPHNVGEGTDVAIVADPFGNYVGLIQITN